MRLERVVKSTKNKLNRKLCPLLETMGNFGFKINVDLNSFSLPVQNTSQTLFNTCFPFLSEFEEGLVIGTVTESFPRGQFLKQQLNFRDIYREEERIRTNP